MRADDSDEPSVFVPAKKVAVSSPSVSASSSPPLPSASASSSAGPGLPVTGDDTMLFVGAAAIAVAVGTVLFSSQGAAVYACSLTDRDHSSGRTSARCSVPGCVEQSEARRGPSTTLEPRRRDSGRANALDVRFAGC
ncbi:hypothetical protein AB0K35_04390 [Micromonospora sp. NPDC053740]|uniref:hypothetical protein n=1 Tax=Micromonospora sp. NPDC053740 TaxID=3155173 RepID=UPI00343CAB27